MKMKFALTLFVAGFGTSALAAPMTYVLPEETAHFKEAEGVDVVKNNCSACHSADYIATQPAKKGKDFWTAEANKMIKVYGAPIEASDIDAIVGYLAENY
ncbi:MAG TPA: cytochrome c [Rhizobiales bacterium]|nr:cytochrome c [Hyphomicrobiales bacterium]